MNLINDAWIPVRRADGTSDNIRPALLTDHLLGKSPIIAVASPRPDFDGALTQFLIGLLQTTCTPNTRDDWWDWREVPPSPDEFQARFSTVAQAFELEGGRAFMQDATPADLTSDLDVAVLLIEAPGESTQEHNKDHFIKRGCIDRLCPSCAAAALFSLQTNAPAGGQGHRTGLRGSGPLTTLVLGSSLWETCWLNVLEDSRFFAGFERVRHASSDCFPWLVKTRTSEAKPPAGVTTTGDVHPSQQYWGMPRRIRLGSEDFTESVICDLCGTEGHHFFTRFHTRNYGINYEGFEHPLSPHYVKDGQVNPVHPQPGGIAYRHWLGLVEGSGGGERKPAKVIEQFRTLREDGRLWAFGFDMDNMKARCWYDANMPVIAVPEGIELFRAWVEQMVQAANLAAGDLRRGLKEALFGNANPRGDLTFLTDHFWGATERAFYAHVQRLREFAPKGQGEQGVMESWLAELRSQAFTTFDHYAQTGDFDAVSPRRLAKARNDLSHAMGSKKIRTTLGLPPR